MTMPASRVARPSTIEEAVRLLADNGPEAVIIAGGTDVVPNLQMKLFTPRVLVDIKPIRALQGITIAAAGALRLGALTTLTEIVGSPLLQASYPAMVAAAQYGYARGQLVSGDALPVVQPVSLLAQGVGRLPEKRRRRLPRRSGREAMLGRLVRRFCARTVDARRGSGNHRAAREAPPSARPILFERRHESHRARPR